MAFGLKYFFVDKKDIGTADVTYRWELYEEGYAGAATQWNGVSIQRNYDEIDGRDIYTNLIQSSQLTGVVRVESSSQRTIIENIAVAAPDQYLCKLKLDGNVIWTGKLLPDLINIGEENYGNQTANFVAKDLVFQGNYTLQTGSASAISIIADILDNLGYGIGITSYTNWEEDNTEADSDDILNVIYHEKERLRQYAQSDDEVDRAIPLKKALEYVLTAYGLILRQTDNRWRLIQITALSDSTSVPYYEYNSAGTQGTTGTVNLDVAVDNDDLHVFGSSTNRYYAGIKQASATFEHESSIQGINVPTGFQLTTTDRVFTQFLQSDGTQTIRLQFAADAYVPTGTQTNSSVDITIQADTYYWDGTSWVDGVANSVTFTSIPGTVPGEDQVGTDYDVFRISGFINTLPLPADADGTLTVTFSTATNADRTDYQRVQFAVELGDGIQENNQSIDYELTQDLNFNKTYDYGSFFYGNGPSATSLSALKDSTDNLTVNWRRTTDAGTVDNDHAEILLREVLDAQRGQRRNLQAVLYGEYQPVQVVSYDSQKFIFLGGSWDSKSYQWTANLLEIDIVTDGDDVLEAFYTDRRSGTASSFGSSGSDGDFSDGSYLQISNNLSDLDNATTARTNLGVAIGSDVQAQSSILQDLSDNLTATATELNRLDGNLATVRSNLGLSIGSDVQAYDDQLYTLSGLSAGQAADLVAITEAEYTQLQNINSVTISNTQWGYLGALNQSLTTTSNVTFNNGTFNGTLDVSGESTFNQELNLEVADTTSMIDYVSSDGINSVVNFWESGGNIMKWTPRVSGVIDQTRDFGYSFSDGNWFAESSFLINGNNDRSAFLKIQSDVSNIDEGKNSYIWLLQDGVATQAKIGFAGPSGSGFGGDTITNASANALLINHVNTLPVEIATNNTVRASFNSSISLNENTSITGTLDVSGDVTAESNLFVEGGLFANEFVVNTTRVLTDFAMSAGGKIGNIITATAGSEVITFVDENGTTIEPFGVNDILHIQIATGATSGTIVKNIYRKVASISSSQFTLTTTGITWTTGDDVGSLAVGDSVVRKGNTAGTTDRDHYIKFDISGNGGVEAPTVTVFDNVTDVEDNGDIRLMYGKLDGQYGIGSSAEEFGFAVGDSSLSGNHIVLTPSTTAFQLDTFELEANTLKVNSTGSTFPDADNAFVEIDSTPNQDFTSSNLNGSLEFDPDEADIIRVEFNYDLSVSGGSIIPEIEVEVEGFNGSTWESLDIRSGAGINISYNISAATTGPEASFTTLVDNNKVAFKATWSSGTSFEGTIYFYFEPPLDSTYTKFRMVFKKIDANTGVTYQIDRQEAWRYTPVTELNPKGLWIRLADTLISRIGSGGVQTYQDISLLD